MKALVVYYSKTGNTRKAGDEIAKQLRCDKEELIDTKFRCGILGYIKGGYDAMRKKLTVIKKVKNDPSEYDIVIIGTPVWGWTLVPAVRTYLAQNKKKFKKLAYFCTMDGSGDDKTFSGMEEITGMKPMSTATFMGKDIKQGDIKDDVAGFIKALN